jgi:FtsP/CotA-like multicopper oxidase with cupredoxin domain
MTRTGLVVVASVVSITLGLAAPAGDRQAAASCPTDPDAAADLHCIELLPPLNGPDARGTAELFPPASPFGAAVSRTGALRHRVVLRLSGLPDPSELGDVEGYVAWVTTPRHTPVRRLGRVHNGRNEVGEVAFNRFLILVSAEADTATDERRGRLVLRGTSPSLRMHPHDFESFLSTAAAGRVEEGDTAQAAERRDAWAPPPIPPQISPVPGLRDLRPDADPFTPAYDPATLREARPGRTVRLEDGDTLRLAARPVRRRVADRVFAGYAFNGRVPGPLIRVQRGAEITVLFRNEIDLPTTVHWHGLRLDNAFDGVPDLTQEPVAPGESFVYRLVFPDAGLYWYHPHVREDIQQDLGLYGNIRVDPLDSDWLGPVNREEVLVLDDMLLDEAGPIPWGREVSTHAMMGRFGNVLLVNGEPTWELRVRRGEVVRFYLTNVASTRVFHLDLDGAQLKAVATDLGRYPTERRIEGVVMAPAERYLVEARFPSSGTFALTNRVQGVNHALGSFYADVDTLGTVTVTDDSVPPEEDRRHSFDELRSHPDLQEQVARLDPWREGPPDRQLLLTLEAGELPFPIGPMMRADSLYFSPVEWTGSMAVANWITTTREARWILRDPETGLENGAIDWRFQVGDTVKLKLVNDRDAFHAMQHPIHLHGQRFLVLSRDGVPERNPAWKDTVLMPVGSTAELLVELTNPGEWMLHCHIAEHLQAGMQTVFTVDSGPGATGRSDLLEDP